MSYTGGGRVVGWVKMAAAAVAVAASAAIPRVGRFEVLCAGTPPGRLTFYHPSLSL
jgi:hypothetical protein